MVGLRGGTHRVCGARRVESDGKPEAGRNRGTRGQPQGLLTRRHVPAARIGLEVRDAARRPRGLREGIVCFRDGQVFFASASTQREAGRQAADARRHHLGEAAAPGPGSDEDPEEGQGRPQARPDPRRRGLRRVRRFSRSSSASRSPTRCSTSCAGTRASCASRPTSIAPTWTSASRSPSTAVCRRRDAPRDAWNRIRDKIPSMDTRFAMSSSPGQKPMEIHLKPREWMLLCYPARQPKRLANSSNSPATTTSRPRRSSTACTPAGSSRRSGQPGSRWRTEAMADSGGEPQEGPDCRGVRALPRLDPPALRHLPRGEQARLAAHLARHARDAVRVRRLRRVLSRCSRRSEDEFKELMNLVTINETSFFRFPAQFDALRDRVIPEILESKSKVSRSFRVWSAGCSTGEEPYTHRDDAARLGARGRWAIAARCSAPTSRRRRSSARKAAVYPAESLANLPQNVVQRWFEPVTGGHRPDRARPRHRRLLLPQPDQGAVPARAAGELGRHLLPQRHDLLPARVDAPRRRTTSTSRSIPAATCSSATPRRSRRSPTGSSRSRSAACSCTASRMPHSAVPVGVRLPSRSPSEPRRRGPPPSEPRGITARAAARPRRPPTGATHASCLAPAPAPASSGSRRRLRPTSAAESTDARCRGARAARAGDVRPTRAPSPTRRSRIDPRNVEALLVRALRARRHRRLRRRDRRRDGGARDRPAARAGALHPRHHLPAAGRRPARARRVQAHDLHRSRLRAGALQRWRTSTGRAGRIDDACREYENTLRALYVESGRRRGRRFSAGSDRICWPRRASAV